MGDQFAKAEPAIKSEALELATAGRFLRAGAAHLDGLVDMVIDYGVSVIPMAFRTISHQHEPRWTRSDEMLGNVVVLARYGRARTGARLHAIGNGEALPPNGGLWFDLRVEKTAAVPASCYVRWRITNTGALAISLDKGRGDFYSPTEGVRRWEPLAFRGVHIAEAFVIHRTTERLVGVSTPFHVVIR